MTNKCLDCGKNIYLYSKRCKSCSAKGKLNSQWKDGRKSKKYFCRDCSKNIHPYTFLYGKGRCRLCSLKGKNNPNYNNHILKGKKFPDRSIKFKGKRNPAYKDGRTLKPKYCIDCGKKISYTATRCLSCCFKELFKNPAEHPSWRGGLSFQKYTPDFNESIRREVKERDGYRCKICSILETNCKRKLHIHHIDYNKKNNTINNFISLCHSCHAKTSTNRNYWTQYFLET